MPVSEANTGETVKQFSGAKGLVDKGHKAGVCFLPLLPT